jgi:hypothetical protein
VGIGHYIKWASPPTSWWFVSIYRGEHHCREEQGILGFWGIPALNRTNQPIEMRVLTNLKDTVATDALIGCIQVVCQFEHVHHFGLFENVLGPLPESESKNVWNCVICWHRRQWRPREIHLYCFFVIKWLTCNHVIWERLLTGHVELADSTEYRQI